LSFKKRTRVVKIRVIPFASTMGRFPKSKPYTNHRKIPVSRERHMRRERSFVSLFLNIFRACGIKEKVVHAAAASPIMVIMLIGIFLNGG